MEAIRQVYEKMPGTIAVPPELQDQRVEVILQPLAEPPVPSALPELRDYSVEELAAEFGMKPEDILDPWVMKFAGCMPDFPPREPQGEYETRLEWE